MVTVQNVAPSLRSGRSLLLALVLLTGCAHQAPPVLTRSTRSYTPATPAPPHDPEAHYTPPVTTIPDGPDVTDADGNLLPETSTDLSNSDGVPVP